MSEHPLQSWDLRKTTPAAFKHLALLKRFFHPPFGKGGLGGILQVATSSKGIKSPSVPLLQRGKLSENNALLEHFCVSPKSNKKGGLVASLVTFKK